MSIKQNLMHLIPAVACMTLLLPGTTRAQNTINFSVNDAGVSKSVETWGVDIAWANYNNVRQSIEHIGLNNVDIARVLVYIDEPLVDLGAGNYGLTNAAKSKIDNHLALAAMAGNNIPLTFGIGGSGPDEIDPDYVSGSGINVTNYVRVIKATQEYINSRPGFTASPIYAIEPFNEPDFNFTQANPADLNSIIQQLKTYDDFRTTLMVAPSVLNSDNAQWWYDQVPQATAGSSHLLAGSLTSWTNFIDNVNNDSKPFINPEIHSMGEILAGAEHGMAAGMVWADVLRGRGTLIQASDGDRLGYAEDLANQSAGAVYRAPDGQIYAFAGGLERDYTGSPSTYRFVSTDQDVYFNGIPVREFVMQTKMDDVVSDSDNDFQNYGSWSSEGAFVNIDTDDSGIPALDGYRWKIVNTQTGEVMEVVGGSTSDGGLIESDSDDGGLNQMWNIVRTRNGYYHLYNANSGRTAEVANLSLSNGADVRQWGTADNAGQQWYIEETGNGTFYIRNAFSNKYMTSTGSGGNYGIVQDSLSGALNQQWEFVLSNPEASLRLQAEYAFEGDATDNTGNNHGTLFGSPAFTAGNTNQGLAIDLDGINDYVQLPGTIADTSDITIETWIKWDGGDAWQRIFDFGNDTDEYMFLTPMSAGNKTRFAITTDSYQEELALEADALPVGQWVHIAVTLGGNTAILYIDGVPQSAGQFIIDPDDFNPAFNYIGKSQFSNDAYFNGLIDDFNIYDWALTSEQIKTLYEEVILGISDLNGDGFVGLDDLDIVLSKWNNVVRDGDPADPSGDNYVGLDDLDIVLANWNAGTPPGSTANIPEPTGSAVLVLGLSLWFTKRQHSAPKG